MINVSANLWIINKFIQSLNFAWTVGINFAYLSYTRMVSDKKKTETNEQKKFSQIIFPSFAINTRLVFWNDARAIYDEFQPGKITNFHGRWNFN